MNAGAFPVIGTATATATATTATPSTSTTPPTTTPPTATTATPATSTIAAADHSLLTDEMDWETVEEALIRDMKNAREGRVEGDIATNGAELFVRHDHPRLQDDDADPLATDDPFRNFATLSILHAQD